LAAGSYTVKKATRFLDRRWNLPVLRLEKTEKNILMTGTNVPFPIGFFPFSRMENCPFWRRGHLQFQRKETKHSSSWLHWKISRKIYAAWEESCPLIFT